MWTIIILCALGIFIGIWQEKKYGYCPDFYDYLLHAVLYFLLSVPVALILAFALPADLKKVKRISELEAINDGQSINGSFFLGSGHIEGRMQYAYYVKNGDFYRLWSVDASDAFVRYTNGKPTRTIVKEEYTDAFINYFALDETSTYYIFDVPKGSIQSNYSLDAN